MIYCGNCGAGHKTNSEQSQEIIRCSNCGAEFHTTKHTGETSMFSLFCPGCGKSVYFTIEKQGENQSCPYCWLPFQLPELKTSKAHDSTIHYPDVNLESNTSVPEINNEVPDQAIVQNEATLCPICQTNLLQQDLKTTSCPECNTIYHTDCWEENNGCAVYGCPMVPDTEHYQSIEIPVSYWGQENKACPKCGQEILAAAVRCRHCGETFSTAEPLTPQEFKQRRTRQERFPALRRTIIWLCIFCFLPCSAPLAVIIGFVWYYANRQDIKAMPAIYSALCKVALGVALGQTALAILMFILSSFTTVTF
jgi:predicted RNA-binding Zn-ribbon protein involved in translation (DUF1610 family)